MWVEQGIWEWGRVEQETVIRYLYKCHSRVLEVSFSWRIRQSKLNTPRAGSPILYLYFIGTQNRFTLVPTTSALTWVTLARLPISRLCLISDLNWLIGKISVCFNNVAASVLLTKTDNTVLIVKHVGSHSGRSCCWNKEILVEKCIGAMDSQNSVPSFFFHQYEFNFSYYFSSPF